MRGRNDERGVKQVVKSSRGVGLEASVRSAWVGITQVPTQHQRCCKGQRRRSRPTVPVSQTRGRISVSTEAENVSRTCVDWAAGW